MQKIHKLSPSDFAFLWEQCKRCFYLKVVHGIRQPSMPMARIFKRIESLQMGFYDGKDTREVSADLPPGVMRCGEKWVESDAIRPPGRESGCYILGKVDSLIEFEDGSWGVIDFKTTQTRGDHIRLYSRQLHAYVYGLENPARSSASRGRECLHLDPISKIGLLCFEPTDIAQPAAGRHSYEGDVRWVEMERDDGAFLSFIGEVADLLDKPMPGPTGDCNWCRYGTELVRRQLVGAAPAAAGPAAAGGDATCPKCGSPMVRRDGRRGAFLGCSRFPDCRGTRDL